MEFPASFYKRGTAFLWDGEMFDYVIVTDQEEADIALADGWVPHKPEEAEPRAELQPEPVPSSQQAPVTAPKRRGRKPKVSL